MPAEDTKKVSPPTEAANDAKAKEAKAKKEELVRVIGEESWRTHAGGTVGRRSTKEGRYRSDCHTDHRP
jgi:hypothetical protein